MPSAAAGRDFVDGWLATQLLHTGWDERIAHIFLLSPGTRNGILYEAGVVHVEDSGIWVACFDDTAGDGGTRTLGTFGHVKDALEEFAALAEQAADRLDHAQRHRPGGPVRRCAPLPGRGGPRRRGPGRAG